MSDEHDAGPQRPMALVAHFDGAAPGGGQTVLSQIAHRSVGSGAAYGFVQVATTLILLVAADSAFEWLPAAALLHSRETGPPLASSCAWAIASRSPPAFLCSRSRRP